MTGSQDSAFDLAQDAYIRAFTRINQFDGRSAFGTWLYRIAVTEALQFLRREKRFRSSRQERASDAAVDSPLELETTRMDVNEALAALESGDRAILLLRYQEGQSYRAIAEMLDCEEGTVASRLNRARNRLKGILGKGYAQEEEGDAGEHQKKGDSDRAGARAAADKPASRGRGRK